MIVTNVMSEIREHKKIFTVQEYYQMASANILTEDSRTELIRGEIFYMSPIGSRHAGCTNRLSHRFILSLSDLAVIQVQNPVLLNDTSEVEPDISVLKKREDFYAGAHPVPEDVLLLVEISDSTLKYDKEVKLPLYAESGIAEVWLVNLREACVEVHTEPSEHGYETCRKFRRGKEIASPAFPEIGLKVEDVIGDA